jgi:hypothetical protein
MYFPYFVSPILKLLYYLTGLVGFYRMGFFNCIGRFPSAVAPSASLGLWRDEEETSQTQSRLRREGDVLRLSSADLSPSSCLAC